MEFELCYKGTKLVCHKQADDVQLCGFWDCLIQSKSINWNLKEWCVQNKLFAFLVELRAVRLLLFLLWSAQRISYLLP